MTDKEHAALEWLDELIKTKGYCPSALVSENASTIKAMLAHPTVPAVNDHRAIDELAARLSETTLCGMTPTALRVVLVKVFEALHEPEKPAREWGVTDGKEIVWHDSREDAERVAQLAPTTWAVVRLTGKSTEVAPAEDGCSGRTLAERRA